MQKGQRLVFACQCCQRPVPFSVLDLKRDQEVDCANCGVSYAFGDPALQRQIQTFESLCQQIADSEEILSNTSVGIQLGGQEVRIPYRILLTRLNSKLDLVVGDQKLTIAFRMEPRQDLLSQEVVG
jgi:hypothetical protein